ncbi:MAG: hypothetical protein HUJ90_07490, partial [Bacteroidales bacterium]|nr:hypothetical protein [Bacteroidales bacterium]
AQFVYSNTFNDPSRYHRLYDVLSSRYGYPVYSDSTPGGWVESWYGGDSRGWVTLEYVAHGNRYYTTLSYGC